MKDGYTTNDLVLGCALLYLYGENSLLRIERDPVRGQTLQIDCQSLDADEYFNEFKEGRLAISDLRTYMRIYDTLIRRLKDMQRRGDLSWCSEAWQRGVTSDGRKVR
jgi:hypothetical protein